MNLTDAKAWDIMLEEIDEKPWLDKLRQISLSGKTDTGCISAIKEILSLKNRYPDKHLRINSLKATVTDVLIPD